MSTFSFSTNLIYFDANIFVLNFECMAFTCNKVFYTVALLLLLDVEDLSTSSTISGIQTRIKKSVFVILVLILRYCISTSNETFITIPVRIILV